ncbi:MAG: tetratricopeptide repeat protein [Phycisphaerales bacterium]
MSATPSTKPPAEAARGAEGSGASAPSPAAPGFTALLRDSWQIPVLVLAIGAIAGAIWYARAHRAPSQWSETLAQANGQIARGEFAVARTILEEVIAPHLQDAPEGFARVFEVARADLAAAEVLAAGAAAEPSDAVAKRYEALMAEGAVLDDSSMARYSELLLACGRESDAVDAALRAGEDARARALARKFGRRTLEQAYARAGSDPRAVGAFFEALEDFRDSVHADAEDLAWSGALAGRIRLGAGQVEKAREQVLIDLGRADSALGTGERVSIERYTELWYLLGEAYRREKMYTEAENSLAHARRSVSPSSELEGEIDLALGLAELELAENPTKAYAILDRAVLAEHPSELKANLRLARARASAALGQLDDALRDFRELVALDARGSLQAVTAGEAESAMNELARDELARGHLGGAIALAELVLELADSGLGVANAHAIVADSASREARARRDTEIARVGGAAGMDPGERAIINRLFRKAASAFGRYLETETGKAIPVAERAELLFAAADCLDCAGEADAALDYFRRSLAELKEGDSKRTEALIRIGDIHHQQRDFEKAREAYESVYAITRNDPRVAMPLCRVLVDSGDTTRALAELGRILEGGAGLRPESEQYLEALELFARLSFDRGDFVACAERLRELVERDPDAPAVGERRFRLAESLQRLGRVTVDESDSATTTEARRAELARRGRERLAEAQQEYQLAIDALEVPGATLDGLRRDMLREAYLQRAHCAFDRGDLRESVDFYETVVRKYPESPVGMFALIQIVNASDRLGETKRADAAHLRALRLLKSMSDESIRESGAVLTRSDWQDWLRRRPSGGAEGGLAQDPGDSTGGSE